MPPVALPAVPLVGTTAAQVDMLSEAAVLLLASKVFRKSQRSFHTFLLPSTL
jgi:hypothetical protein